MAYLISVKAIENILPMMIIFNQKQHRKQVERGWHDVKPTKAFFNAYIYVCIESWGTFQFKNDNLGDPLGKWAFELK